MTPSTLEPETLSDPAMRSVYDRWNSTTGKPDASGYARLSPFDFSINAELDCIAALKRNWDAQGAYPVDPSFVKAARELISTLPIRVKDLPDAIPAVVPMRKGNLQFEWHRGQKTLELEIETPATIHYLKFYPDDCVEEEDLCDISDTDKVVELIQWFVGE